MIAIAGFDGAHVLVIVNMGTTAAPNWQVVAAQTGFSEEASREMLDGSVKGTDHAQSSYGRMESTATLDGLVSFADGTQQYLKDAMKNRETIVLRHEVAVAALPAGTAQPRIYEANALISSVSSEYPDNENSSFSAEFNLNEAWRQIQ